MQAIAEKTVREIAIENPASVPVLESLGIDYCCGGGKRLRDACLRAGVDVDQVLLLIEKAQQDSRVNDARDWREEPLSDLIMHIVGKHHTYVRQETLRIEALLMKVAAKHGAAHPELHEIEALFGAIGQELSTHMFKEEHVLFPYIERAEDAAEQRGPRPQACFDSVKRPIANMIADHDDAGALLRRIRELANSYTAPGGACASFQALYQALEAFERDLHQHVHLENNILFPRAVAMEETH